MIRFEFTVSDEEAETLIDLLVKARGDALYHAVMNDGAERTWWEHHAQYLDELRHKMHNKLVP